MTCKELLEKEHPDIAFTHEGIGCPHTYGYTTAEDDSKFCLRNRCGQCWDRPVDITMCKFKNPNDLYQAMEDAGIIKEGTVTNMKKLNTINFPEDVVNACNEAGKALGITTEAMRTIKDSGDRTKFETGAVRDMREGKGRCDLMPLEVVSYIFSHESWISKIFDNIAMFQKDKDTACLNMAICDFAKQAYPEYRHPEVHMLLEVAKHFEEGAKKYGENNWQKGIPAHCYIDSAVRHYLKWLRGDTDEPHDRAFVWNLMCCIWEVDYHKEET